MYMGKKIPPTVVGGVDGVVRQLVESHGFARALAHLLETKDEHERLALDRLPRNRSCEPMIVAVLDHLEHPREPRDVLLPDAVASQDAGLHGFTHEPAQEAGTSSVALQCRRVLLHERHFFLHACFDSRAEEVEECCHVFLPAGEFARVIEEPFDHTYRRCLFRD